MKIAIIKYNAGNIMSVEFAIRRLGIEPLLTDDPEIIRSADKVIFPGVGEASTTMQFLKKKGLDSIIKSLTQPVLGICLGLQLMCKHSEEGNTDCIGIFNAKIKRFENTGENSIYKIPQMGWNTIKNVKKPLFDFSLEGRYVYFNHSFYIEPAPETIATTDYIIDFSAALQKDNYFGTQFHPEKSGKVGEQILKNFIAL